ncbi:MAG: twin-arginine translocase TatA/TatE family subunit [Chthoniobacterales bacterium]
MSLSLLAFNMPSMPDTIFILLLILLVFGSKRLPEIARSIGESLKEFQKARHEFEQELHKAAATTPPPPPPIEITQPKDRQPHQPD